MNNRSASREELANAVTHAIGLGLSLIALPMLVAAAASRGDIPQIVGASIFAVTLIVLYAASTVYHWTPPSRAKEILQVVDHAAIFLLIAGTYTPFTLGVLRGSWGWSLLAVVWGLALVGIAGKVLFGVRFPRVSTLFYLLMGWLAVVAIRPLAVALPAAGIAWLIAGGLLYTTGVVFYVRDRPRYSHTIWHLFVLAGSACHFVAVWGYAAPLSRAVTLRS